jgi:hypothetical protein
MTTITDIKAAIDALPQAEQAALKRWLDERDAVLFDQKIESDAAAGRLDDVIARARANHKAGRSTPL